VFAGEPSLLSMAAVARARKPHASRAPKSTAHEVNANDVPKNAKGGVLVTDEELRAAFEFFDMDGRGKITAASMRKRLGAFYKNMNPREYRFLMNSKRSAC
jgi:hypothetical protein